MISRIKVNPNRLVRCVIQSVPVQTPKNATKWFSVFADNEASRLNRYYISFSVSFLKYPGDVIHAFVGNPRF